MRANAQLESRTAQKTLLSGASLTLLRIVLLLLASVQMVLGRPAAVILLRHAEKPEDELDVHLSAKGRERARALVALMTNTPALLTNGLPVALFATRSTQHGSQRTRETLEPLSQQLKLPIRSLYLARDYAALAEHILHNPTYEGKTVVVCWVHDYLPQLAQALGVKSKLPPWKSNVFDRLWLITYQGKEPSLASLPQNLLPGDSQEDETPKTHHKRSDGESKPMKKKGLFHFY